MSLVGFGDVLTEDVVEVVEGVGVGEVAPLHREIFSFLVDRENDLLFAQIQYHLETVLWVDEVGDGVAVVLRFFLPREKGRGHVDVVHLFAVLDHPLDHLFRPDSPQTY